MEASEINALLEARVKELAARKAAGSREELRKRIAEDRPKLMRCLGLYPLPPRTDLHAHISGTLPGDGYRIEKIRYESRPGLVVTAHLYIPEGTGPFPVILSPHGHFFHKKTEPQIQSQAISAALYGMATLVVDSPGKSWDAHERNERAGMGVHDDPFLAMGACIQGAYVWDLMRGLDYLETRPEINAKKVGITGCSGGGTATIFAFAADERISTAVPVCAASSLEDMPHNGCLCNHVPGSLELGDRADILALRAPAPVLVVGATDDPEFPPAGMTRTHEKLERLYRLENARDAVRLCLVDSPHEYNRRMREAMLGFFAEHLLGQPRREYLIEKRPLTDGTRYPATAGTLSPDLDDLLVTQWHERATLTFRELLYRAMQAPYPEPFDASQRLVRWGRLGSLKGPRPGEVLALHDASVEAPKEAGSWRIPTDKIDFRLAIYLGLSVPEVLAQMLHLFAPGGPEGYEAIPVAGDLLGNALTSVRGLIRKPEEARLTRIVAEGPVASLTARHLKLLRPSLEIQVSHEVHSWTDLIGSDAALTVPNARYMAWPYG